MVPLQPRAVGEAPAAGSFPQAEPAEPCRGLRPAHGGTPPNAVLLRLGPTGDLHVDACRLLPPDNADPKVGSAQREPRGVDAACEAGGAASAEPWHSRATGLEESGPAADPRLGGRAGGHVRALAAGGLGGPEPEYAISAPAGEPAELRPAEWGGAGPAPPLGASAPGGAPGGEGAAAQAASPADSAGRVAEDLAAVIGLGRGVAGRGAGARGRRAAVSPVAGRQACARDV